MEMLCRPSQLRGSVTIPGSKSHTIRAIAIASLAQGRSRIEAPLASADTLSAVAAYRALGAKIDTQDDLWTVDGFGPTPAPPDNVIDIGNSGTTMRVVMGSCALLPQGAAIMTGDKQIRVRPAGPLAQALTQLGATASSTRNNGCAPFVISGRLQGGKATIEAVTSQYITSLLLCCPLAENDTHLDVPLLHEKPYVEITLDWLRRQEIQVEHNEDMSAFDIPGGQRFKPFERRIPADFSSATFFLCAGALPGADILVQGLDLTDPQGDKAVIDYLKTMGANVQIGDDGVRVRPGELRGCEIDMNATPDALPMMAVLACFAQGQTRLVNVPQARIKETDRIAVMAAELTKMGAKTQELPDGLVIEESPLHGAKVQGHFDHRIVMALAVAATAAQDQTTIDTAEAVAITFPTFAELMKSIGAELQVGG